jgi:hypothetical protein
MRALRAAKTTSILALAVAASLLNLGCPPVPGDGDTQLEYDLGFQDGFDDDQYYWNGYWDGWDTVDDDPVYYAGDLIPDVDSPAYDAGYNDGLWYSYNDGYFTDYRYAFIVGFSEGYDNAYWPDYLDFLAADMHPEFLNGGWGDGYHDGYSEGRVFGAVDFEAGLPFDWLDALLDYESGTDLYFEEIDVGTGEFGPVVLYEYGTNPFDLTKRILRKAPDGHVIPTIRRSGQKDVNPAELPLFRPIIDEAAQELDIAPAESLRSNVELELTSTWLERIDDYRFVTGQKTTEADHAPRPRAVSK